MKTILIISTDSLDITTDCVIDWLRYYGVSFLRINNLINDLSFKISFDNQGKLI